MIVLLYLLSFLGYFYLASDHDEEFDFQGKLGQSLLSD